MFVWKREFFSQTGQGIISIIWDLLGFSPIKVSALPLHLGFAAGMEWQLLRALFSFFFLPHLLFSWNGLSKGFSCSCCILIKHSVQFAIMKNKYLRVSTQPQWGYKYKYNTSLLISLHADGVLAPRLCMLDSWEREKESRERRDKKKNLRELSQPQESICP